MMEYTQLKKLYYSDSEKYKCEYTKRYTSEYAHHIDFLIKGNPAFFVATPEVQSTMLNIYKSDKRVAEICRGLPQKAIEQFSWRCLIDEIVLSNNIEGVHSTRNEIDGALLDVDKRNRFRGIALKYLMLQSGEELQLDSCQDVRNIYDDLVLDEVTEDNPNNMPDGSIFRKGSVSVTSATQKEIHKGVYPEEEIISAMTAALNYLNDPAEELLYRTAVFHYLLGYIHPFYDGNGRLNRFISSYMLTRELEPVLSYRLSYTIKQHIDRYYDAFKVCNNSHNKGDITPFVIMFLDIIAESIELLKKALEKRKKKLVHYTKTINRLPGVTDDKIGEIYSYLIQAELFSERGISTRELLGYLSMSRDTLRKRLEIINQTGLLKMTKYKKENFYGIDLEQIDNLYSSVYSELISDNA